MKPIVFIKAGDRSHRGLGEPYLSAADGHSGVKLEALQGKLVADHFALKGPDAREGESKERPASALV